MGNPVTPGEGAKQLDAMAQALTEIERAAEDARLLEIGEFATALILARTKSGLDADRNAFEPYADKYAAWRTEKKHLSGTPDLAVTGHMMGGLIPVVTGLNEVTLRWLSRVEADKARWNNEGTKGVASVKEHTRTRKAKKRGAGYNIAVVSGHTRSINRPPREFMDIRAEVEIKELETIFGDRVTLDVQKILER